MKFYQKYKEALYEEYWYISKFTSKIALLDGKFLYEESKGYVYLFLLNKEVSIPDEAPITVYNGCSVISGKVLYSESYEIVVSVSKKLDLKLTTEFSSAVYELVKKWLIGLTISIIAIH